jgi:putative glutamine amidotransferase
MHFALPVVMYNAKEMRGDGCSNKGRGIHEMLQPLIGITTYGRHEGDGRFNLPYRYVDSVRRAGGLVVLLPPGEDALGELLNRLDGIILAGGGDVDPERYGGGPHPAIYNIDVERDASELALVHRVIDSEIPTLAICRGFQVVNVAMGGTLLPHVPDAVGEIVLHRIDTPRGPVEHSITVESESQLADILGQTVVSPQSYHHQAIDVLGADLRVVARAADGIIEAVEMPSHPWLVAVQWHPEMTAETDSTQQRLFNALVAKSRSRTSVLATS